MPLFEYKARNRRGESLVGEIEADSPELAADQLFRIDVTPIEINLAKSNEQKTESKAQFNLFSPRVSLEEQIMMCRQFHTLMKSGIPILRGLDALVSTTRNPTLAETLKEIAEDLRSGHELASSFSRHPKVFSPLFVNMVRVGESTGKLDASFHQLANYLELEKNTRNRIKSAMRYPSIVISAVVIAVIIINIFVIPAFADVFAKFNADLPLATRFLISTSDFFVVWWKEMLVVSLLSFVAFRVWLNTDDGSYLWSRFILKIPLVGGIVQRALLARFGRSVSMSIKAGVPLVQSLTSVAGALDNAYMAERVLGMRNGIESGDSIFRTSAATGLFTPLVLQMIAVGEETGTVDDLLEETAEHYEREVEYELTRLSDALEPIIIVIIGVMVMVLALGVFLPMWDLSSVAFNK
jgi:MSHA biogenesis protein MshG